MTRKLGKIMSPYGEPVELVLTGQFPQTGLWRMDALDPQDGTLWTQVGKNVYPDQYVAPDDGHIHVLVKDYAENRGFLEAIIKAGIAVATGVVVESGFAELHEVIVRELTGAQLAQQLFES